MYCSNCGKQLADNSKCCPSCGKAAGIQQTADELAELVAKARAGDPNAVAALYKKTYSQVFYTVKSMIKDDDTVFDILQDSYIKAFTHLDSFEGNEKFLPWVRQIAANTARDFLKKKRPMLFTDLGSDDELDTPLEERFVDERSGAIPDDVIDQQETVRLIREIIDSLPEDQRAVIGMYYYQEMPVKDIAAALGASESAVKSRLLYGRKKIETKVRDLEKKGTKLYGLAPIPFLLWLFRSQKAYASELPPNEQILQNLLESTAKSSASAARAKAAGTATNAASQTAAATSSTAGTAAVGAGGLGAVKIALIALTTIAVIGAGAFGISRLLQTDSNPEQEIVTETESIPPTEESVITDVETETSEPLEELPEEELSPVEDALEQYRSIINQADTYQYDPYDSAIPTGNYRYALVQMQPDDSVPTLLLEQETTDYLYFTRVFQYDPENGTVLEPSENLMEGTSQTGGYRGSLGMMGDGNGIRITDASSGTGGMTISRATLDGDSLHTVMEYEGYITDPVPDALGFQEIQWYDIADMTALDSWAADAQTPDSIEAALDEASGTETSLPTDGERIVCTGTVETYTYDEVIALQKIPESQVQWLGGDTNQKFRLIVLDVPQEMALINIDGDLRSDEVILIDISYTEGLEQYEGQHLTFSIDPNNTYWPSDTSLPLGQPATKDIHILN